MIHPISRSKSNPAVLLEERGPALELQRFSGRGAAGGIEAFYPPTTHHLPSTLQPAHDLRPQHSFNNIPVSGADPRMLLQLPHALRFLLRISRRCRCPATPWTSLYTH